MAQTEKGMATSHPGELGAPVPASTSWAAAGAEGSMPCSSAWLQLLAKTDSILCIAHLTPPHPAPLCLFRSSSPRQGWLQQSAALGPASIQPCPGRGLPTAQGA